jgi:hypothetical protein
MGKHENAITWSPEEKQRLIDLNSLHPKQWLVISKQMNRTPASLRNCFSRIDPGKERICTNVCKRCGQFLRGHVCSTPYSAVRMKLRGSDTSPRYSSVKLKLSENDTENTDSLMLERFVIDYTFYVKPHIFSVSEMEEEWSVFEM